MEIDSSKPLIQIKEEIKDLFPENVKLELGKNYDTKEDVLIVENDKQSIIYSIKLDGKKIYFQNNFIGSKANSIIGLRNGLKQLFHIEELIKDFSMYIY
jgi:hypothetical protein